MNLNVDFDPGILSVVTSFFAVCGKYAFLFGIFRVLIDMIVRAATGKERFL